MNNKLKNVEKLAKHVGGYDIIPRKELKKIFPSLKVKVKDYYQEFWVTIIRVGKDGYSAEITDKTYTSESGLKIGSKIFVRRCNIITIEGYQPKLTMFDKLKNIIIKKKKNTSIENDKIDEFKKNVNKKSPLLFRKTKSYDSVIIKDSPLDLSPKKHRSTDSINSLTNELDQIDEILADLKNKPPCHYHVNDNVEAMNKLGQMIQDLK